MRSPSLSVATFLVVAVPPLTTSCIETRGSAWMKQPLVGHEDPLTSQGQLERNHREDARPTSNAKRRSKTIGPRKSTTRSSDRSTPTGSRVVRDHGSSSVQGKFVGVFRNTYYSFPSESDFSQSPTTKLYDASCHPIATVSLEFHDMLCVQGSGRLASHRTVSFAKRDCECARTCPRSGQKICYSALPPDKFPWGRGAAGLPIHPFRTIAADTSVLPMGTVLYIPEYAGKPVPDGGGLHDGCFRVEDRGKAIQGTSVDIFVGATSSLRVWNDMVPTGDGVSVYLNHEACNYLRR